MTVTTTKTRRITVVTIDRPELRNAVDAATASALAKAFRAFDADPDSDVAILTGAQGNFCAGADLKAVSRGEGNGIDPDMDSDGPMGPTRMQLTKPVIAAIEGFAVAGGLELALWCDLRVAATDATFGIYCRRWGVPLVDGGTIRLPRLVGHGRAMDMILTGRPVDAQEAERIGLVNRLSEPGRALDQAVTLAEAIASSPQICLRSDRRSALEQWGLEIGPALALEAQLGLETVATGETRDGASRFARGAGRHGTTETPALRSTQHSE